MAKTTRRALLFGMGAAAGIACTRYLSNEVISPGLPFPPKSSLTKSSVGKNKIVLNDASLLSPTHVSRHIIIKQAPKKQLIESLRAELLEAKAAKRPFAVNTARHSMGGQSLAKDGTIITMDQTWLEADTSAGTYRVAAGVRWSEIIAQLDAIGFSPKVMQSNNDFGVASTFCVNAHGWPVPFSACGSTVQSIKLMLEDGQLVTCSRKENTDLFNMTMGGYGLTGIIIELDVEMVPNARLQPKYERMPGKDFGPRFMAALKADPKIQMAYGRLDVAIDGFFDEALMITYAPTVDQENIPAASTSGFLSKASAKIFRNQLDSDRGKSLRWFIETSVGPAVGAESVSRNSLINEPVITLDDGDPARTDILHEYFISPHRFAEFIQACQDVIPSSYQQLLNITLRYVDTDNESVLAYAPEPRIAAVMLFSQEMSARGEADMHRMTSALIQRTLEIGGTYYLPYRLHATDEQFQQGYQRASEFVSRKRKLDPDLVFQNALWQRYMQKL